MMFSGEKLKMLQEEERENITLLVCEARFKCLLCYFLWDLALTLNLKLPEVPISEVDDAV